MHAIEGFHWHLLPKRNQKGDIKSRYHWHLLQKRNQKGDIKSRYHWHLPQKNLRLMLHKISTQFVLFDTTIRWKTEIQISLTLTATTQSEGKHKSRYQLHLPPKHSQKEDKQSRYHLHLPPKRNQKEDITSRYHWHLPQNVTMFVLFHTKSGLLIGFFAKQCLPFWHCPHYGGILGAVS
jgi:hypothetical protein